MTSTVMDITLTSYNLHGFNQGKVMLPKLCELSDVVLVQEHWLHDDELDIMNSISSNFVSVCSSAMSATDCRGVRHGRPFGGVGLLVHRNLLSVFKSVAKRERFIAAWIGDVLIVNVYFPCMSANYIEQMQCLLSDLNSVICDSGAKKVIIGGDYNFDFSCGSTGLQLFLQSTGYLHLKVCDNMINSSTDPPVTYFQLGSGNSSFIDHFCVSESLVDCVRHSFIVDSGDNLSDHLPLCLVLKLNVSVCKPVLSHPPQTKRLRWDKANLNAYYYGTYDSLKDIMFDCDSMRCEIGCKCDVQNKVDELYNRVVSALSHNADKFVPRVKGNFYKAWWSDALSELKKASISTHELWKSLGRPRSGEIFLQMKRAKIAYKNAIRAHQIQEDSFFSNELHELLMEKDLVSFWKAWNCKVVKNKLSAIIDGATDGSVIVNKFAEHFEQNWTADNTYNTSSNIQQSELFNYISTAKSDDFTLLDVESVNKCLLDMKKCKAPGADDIQTEHLLYAHPLVIIQLCMLFNIMLKHGTVPTLFSMGVIVPVVKDKHGDITDITNYRGITLSPCISKLFEKCLLMKFSHLFAISPLQFGFQKKLSCSHAIYTLRTVTDFYVNGLSTVNVAMLDLSKAFDMVNHTTLFCKLMKLRIPPMVLKLLMSWYIRSTAYVKWGTFTSHCFHLLRGVRQGGVLSPVLFCIYVDSVIQRLRESKLGCWLGEVFVGCILYADDVILMSSSICELQKMVNMCVDEVTKLDMKINARKCSILRFGARYLRSCVSITIQGNAVEYSDKAKYLGVMLLAYKSFAVDIKYMKSKFYRAFNSIYHRVGKLKNELITVQMMNSFCKPYLLYATECVGLTVTQTRSLRNSWQCAISHVFNTTGESVNFICSMIDDMPLDLYIIRTC